MSYINRIPDSVYVPNKDDGDIFTHVDYNQIVDISKAAINENYIDIQKILDGSKVPYNAKKLDGNSLSKQIDGPLSDSDSTVPSSQQVKVVTDTLANEIVDLSNLVEGITGPGRTTETIMSLQAEIDAIKTHLNI